MSNLEDYQRQYITETGDNYPDRPPRLYVRKWPSAEYTQRGKRWVKDCWQWQLRFMEWLVSKLFDGGK